MLSMSASKNDKNEAKLSKWNNCEKLYYSITSTSKWDGWNYKRHKLLATFQMFNGVLEERKREDPLWFGVIATEVVKLKDSTLEKPLIVFTLAVDSDEIHTILSWTFQVRNLGIRTAEGQNSDPRLKLFECKICGFVPSYINATSLTAF